MVSEKGALEQLLQALVLALEFFFGRALANQTMFRHKDKSKISLSI